VTDNDRVTGLLAVIMLLAILFAVVRFVIPAFVNMQTDGGLIGAGLAALFAIGLAATVVLKALRALGLISEEEVDEEE
jgi:hypothetical protein